MSVSNKKDYIDGIKLGEDKKGKKSKVTKKIKKDSEKKQQTEEKTLKIKDEFENEPPFRTDYAKSARSLCNGCFNTIPEGELRIATRAKSNRFRGMMDSWYHETCFWEKAPIDGITEAKVSELETIKSEDQSKIRKKIVEALKNSQKESSGSGSSKRKNDGKNEEISQKKPKKADAVGRSSKGKKN